MCLCIGDYYINRLLTFAALLPSGAFILAMLQLSAVRLSFCLSSCLLSSYGLLLRPYLTDLERREPGKIIKNRPRNKKDFSKVEKQFIGVILRYHYKIFSSGPRPFLTSINGKNGLHRHFEKIFLKVLDKVTGYRGNM